jgi:hypothetical protein
MPALARKPEPPRKPKRTGAKGFGEVQGSSFAAVVTLPQLFLAYGEACAFTGTGLAAEAAADPRGYLLSLTDDSTSLDPTLLIPASLDAIFAFERGHLAVGPSYNFLVDLEHISPEFLDRLNPIGRLRLPSDPAYAPSQIALTPHLIAFATGRRPGR